MEQGVTLITLFIVAVAVCGVIRCGHKRTHNEADIQVVKCDILYRDKVTTQAFLESYFVSNKISIVSSSCYFESGENEDLYSSIYRMILPENLTAAQVVSQLSAYKTIRGIHAKAE